MVGPTATAALARSVLASASLIHHPVVDDIFSSQGRFRFRAPNRLMATMENPAQGFEPFVLEDSLTQIVFIRNPSELRIPLGYRLTPQWQNGLGLVLFRSLYENVVGAIFIHGAMRTHWSAIKQGAWQCLGGLMLFEDRDFEEAIEDVIGKGVAMTQKYRFIDRSLERAGHPNLTQLGGGKGILLHNNNKEGAIRVAAQVAKSLGIYISGSDQNMTDKTCTKFAQLAPHNFAGAADHPYPPYAGHAPSLWTAEGVYAGLRVGCEKVFGQEKAPIFIQGYGNTGQPMFDMATADGHHIAGVVDIDVKLLLKAREAGAEKVFIDRNKVKPEILDKATAEGIQIVDGLAEALHLTPEAGIFIPAAGAHPVTLAVARQLVSPGSQVKIIDGPANNTVGLYEGSQQPLIWLIQRHGILMNNDSNRNRLGATVVVADAIGINETGLKRQVRNVGEDTAEEFDEAFKNGIPPKLWRDRQANLSWNKKLESGEAVGGRLDTRPIAEPDKNLLDELVA